MFYCRLVCRNFWWRVKRVFACKDCKYRYIYFECVHEMDRRYMIEEAIGQLVLSAEQLFYLRYVELSH